MIDQRQAIKWRWSTPDICTTPTSRKMTTKGASKIRYIFLNTKSPVAESAEPASMSKDNSFSMFYLFIILFFFYCGGQLTLIDEFGILLDSTLPLAEEILKFRLARVL